MSAVRIASAHAWGALLANEESSGEEREEESEDADAA